MASASLIAYCLALLFNCGMDSLDIRTRNLHALIEWAGSASALAQMVGTAEAYLSQIKTGKRAMGGDLAARIEAALGLPPGAMSRPDGIETLPHPSIEAKPVFEVKFSRRDPAAAQLAFVRRSTARVAAGNGEPEPELQWSDEDPEPYRFALLRQLGADAKHLAVVTATGDSMEPRIYEGDSVLVDTSQQTVVDGRVYVVWYAGACRVKRLYRTPSRGVLIRSDNSNRYPDLHVDEANSIHLRVIGRVLHVSGREGL